ncbi:MAG: ABC transporter substrate-binding protein [Actinomycetota bacterium]|nr:ABC transporter substrate-binding protein [Actinomycetota bacterium]
MRSHKLLLSAGLTAIALAAVACGGGSKTSATSSPSASAGKAKGAIIVTSANFAENEIIANMYADVLEKAGYQVTRKLKLGSREVYLKALGAGEVDLVPDYVGTLTQVLNADVNGKDANTAKPLASGDLQQTLTNLKPLLDAKNLVALKPSEAADQNSYAVTKATADKSGLSKLSDLSKVNNQLVFGGPPECQTRPQCIQGLQRVYGVTFKSFKTLDAGGPLTINALTGGDIQIGLVFSSDGAVAAKNLVVLKDDKGLTPVDNVLAVIRKDKLTPDLQKLIEAVDAKLTTADLSDLNKKVGVDKADPAEVAKTYLKDKGLL